MTTLRMQPVHIIGGGLAGCEGGVADRAAQRAGGNAKEMRRLGSLIHDSFGPCGLPSIALRSVSSNRTRHVARVALAIR